LERRRADPERMHVLALERDGAAGGGAIQQFAGGQAVPAVPAPAAATDPAGATARVAGDHLRRLLRARGLGQVDVTPEERPLDEVDVGVSKARGEGRGAQVERAGGGCGTAQVIGRADGEDAPVLDQERVGPRAVRGRSRIQRVDPAREDEERGVDAHCAAMPVRPSWTMRASSAIRTWASLSTRQLVSRFSLVNAQNT